MTRGGDAVGISPRLNVKVEFRRRLGQSWHDLADQLEISSYERRRFGQGDEPGQIWTWLEDRGRLFDLPDALRAIGRRDVAELFARDPGSPVIITTRFEAHRAEYTLREIYEEVIAGAGSATVEVRDSRYAGMSYIDLHFVAHRAENLVPEKYSGDSVRRALAERESGRSLMAHIFLVGPTGECDAAIDTVDRLLGPSDPGDIFIRSVPDGNALADELAKTIATVVNGVTVRRSPVPFGESRESNVGDYR